MPLSLYDSLFSKSGKRDSAAEALASMKSQYGAKKGKSVFYGRAANLRKRRRPAKPRK